MEDLVVIGGGFAGLACARAAALRGLRVRVLERRRAIGVRTHTTGIVVKEAAEDWEIPPRLSRRIAGVRLYAPGLRAIDLDSPGYYFLATDTPALLRWFARDAQHAGVRIVGGAPFVGARREGEMWQLDGYPVTARFLVGADGPRSAVAAHLGLGANREFLLGIEAEMADVRGVDPNRLHCFLDARLAPGYIGWVVPGVGGITQVGLACRPPHRPDLGAFTRKLAPLFDLSAARIVGRRGGLIPVGGAVSPLSAPRALLVGDAAGLVSPLTAGGIHTALDSGHRAAHAIADRLLYFGPEPGAALQSATPRWPWKRLLRGAYDLGVPDRFWDLALASAPLRAAARLIYFHKRGALSAAAWRDVWAEERVRA